MKESLLSNSLHLSPVMQAEKEKTAKSKKNNDGKGKKRDGKANADGGKDGNPAKKGKKDLQCSHCGPTAGHTDLHCYHDHQTETAKAKIAENRKNPDMSKHFKQLDHAMKKRSNPAPGT